MFSIIQEDELITLIIASFSLLFIIVKWSQLKIIPSSGTLIFAYGVLFAGWIFTILESFFLGSIMNILEHFCYMFSTVILAFWCRRYFYRNRKKS